MPPVDRPWRLAVLISGSGRTLENLIGVIARGEIDAGIVAVVSSADGVRGLQIAADHSIPTAIIAPKSAPNVHDYAAAIYDQLEDAQPDLIIMAGFLRRLLVLPGWERRILNIHPALLPQAAAHAAGKGFYGDRVHAAVIAQGDDVSGATVHVVTNEYDEGPPLAQAVVPVLPGDTSETLARRVFAAECHLYPEAIRAYMDANPDLKRS